VCIKDIPDPEGPRCAYEIRSDEKRVVPIGIPPVINPYDENALELTMRLKTQWGGRVIALTMCEKAVLPVLKKALSVGADELILLEDQAFKNLTSYATAWVLATAIRKIDDYDLVVTGRQAADWDAGQVGLLLAGILGLPGINLVQSAEIEGSTIRAERLTRTGYERVMAPLPALITVSSEVGDLRLATLKAIQDAKKKPVTKWGAADLSLGPESLQTRTIRSLTPPPPQSRHCVFIEGKSGEEKAESLVLRLRQDKVL
jgi:electron transfer flavoprotein beta subunit